MRTESVVIMTALAKPADVVRLVAEGITKVKIAKELWSRRGIDTSVGTHVVPNCRNFLIWIIKSVALLMNLSHFFNGVIICAIYRRHIRTCNRLPGC